MNRIDRVSAILIHLQSKKYVAAAEIAERFDISVRTVYRDIRALEEAGIPVGAEPGKGYFLVDGFHLPPVMFTRNEATALLMASKMMEKFSDPDASTNFESAMFKIKAVLPDCDKQYLSSLQPNIEVFYKASGNFPGNYMTDIYNALAGNKVLIIDYKSATSSEETTNRVVEPQGLCFYSIGWHLIAYCRMRKQFRDFRLDRISKLTVGSETFAKKKKLSLKEYFYQMASETNLTEVTVSVNKHTAGILQNSKYYYGFVGEEVKNDKIEMDFLTNDLSYIGRWLLMYADSAEIIKPAELKQVMTDFARSLKNNFG